MINTKYVDDYVVFDLETTGFDSKNDKIIEIGALKYKNNQLVETFDVLINPNVDIPTIITDLTGISDSMVQDCENISSVLPRFLDFIGDYPLIAHNASFDLGFLEENIKRLGLKKLTNKSIDTLYLARINIPTYNHKLTTLKKYFHLDYGSHRSLEDCYVTQYVYDYCKNRSSVTN